MARYDSPGANTPLPGIGGFDPRSGTANGSAADWGRTLHPDFMDSMETGLPGVGTITTLEDADGGAGPATDQPSGAVQYSGDGGNDVIFGGTAGQNFGTDGIYQPGHGHANHFSHPNGLAAEGVNEGHA
jgi:hypothetical protein